LDSDGKPLGGKYSYDKYNRQSLPSEMIGFAKKYNNQFYDEAISYCEATFANYYPQNYCPDNVKYYPITHKDSKAHYQQFLSKKLKHFGDYQDAIHFKLDFTEMTLFHSVISMQLNIGLITPRYVLDEILKRQKKDMLHSVEGFVRQLNWREYSRLLYRYAYNKMIHKNYFANHHHLTKAWYDGNLGIKPVDTCIKFAFQYGYLHHILRLMVMCNFMNLMSIHPDDVYKWFMEFSLDSYDWVMISNVYSMGMYGDSGMTTSKVYISSSKYILRMSDAKKDGYWEVIWDILYHYFIYRNYDKFAGRSKIYLSHWDKQRNKKEIIDVAKKLLLKN
jgi:deoxyribodipyrimidine photolyase-related protein